MFSGKEIVCLGNFKSSVERKDALISQNVIVKTVKALFPEYLDFVIIYEIQKSRSSIAGVGCIKKKTNFKNSIKTEKK